MTNSTLKFALLGLVSAALVPRTSYALQQSDDGRSRVIVDGVVIAARGVDGGVAVADVVRSAGLPGGAAKKNVANVKYVPLVVDAAIDSAALVLMNDALSDQNKTHALKLFTPGADGVTGTATDFGNSAVIGAELGGFDAASSAEFTVKLTLDPQGARVSGVRTGVPMPAPRPPAVGGAAFRFDLTGLPTRNVRSVSPLKATRTIPRDDFRGTVGKISVDIANLVIRIGSGDFDAWQTWADDFFVQGHRTDADEKSGTIAMFGPDGRAMYAVQLSHVGLVRLSRPVIVDGVRAAFFDVELYVEGATVVTGAAASAAAASMVGGSASAGAATATTAPMTMQKLVGRISDPSDEGVHDLRAVPRIVGLVRKSYVSDDQEGSSSETIRYVSKLAIDSVVATYSAALTQAGYEATGKNESGTATDFTHYFRLYFTKPGQELDFRVGQTKANGTDFTIDVTTKRAGSLTAQARAMKGIVVELSAKEGSPNDLGARDPADFPRIANSTRKSFRASGAANTPEEEAVYRAKIGIDSTEAFFVNRLNAASWELSRVRESGDPATGTHEITMYWTRAKRAVRLILREVEPGVTEISIDLTTTG